LNVLYVLFFHQILAKGIYYEKTNAIPDQYIIRFKDMFMKSGVVGQVFDPETEPAVEIIHTYSDFSEYHLPTSHGFVNSKKQRLFGYSVKMDKNMLKKALDAPNVAYVEDDSKVFISVPTNFNLQDPKIYVQNNATWGISRIVTRVWEKTKVSGKMRLGNFSYVANPENLVDIYVIDTGINIDHEEFEGRAFWGTTTPAGEDNTDPHGHGTHGKNFFNSSRRNHSRKNTWN